jgi:hypothetical protein
MQGCPSHAARIAPRRGPLRLARPPARRADSTARRRNRCYKSDATATEWRGQQQGCLARFQGCLAGSPALPPRQPCTDSGLPARQPCAGSMAALRTAAGSPAGLSRQPCARFPAALRGSSATARQPCAAALRGSPARQPCAAAGLPRRQPCAAPAALRGSPGCGLFREVRGGASAPPLHPSHAQNGDCPQGKADLRGRRAALHCRPRRAPGAGSPLRARHGAALRWQPSSPALAARQPCAAARLLGRQRCAAGPSAALGGFKAALRAAPPAAAHHSL